MSRSGYSDECDDTLQFGRWRGIIASATRGKRGQKLFKDLAAALDAMPDKKLIKHELVKDGSYCTLGVLGAARGLDVGSIDPHHPESVGKAFDIAPQLAQEIVFENDEQYDHCTPEERWQKMRNWVDSQIIKESIT